MQDARDTPSKRSLVVCLHADFTQLETNVDKNWDWGSPGGNLRGDWFAGRQTFYWEVRTDAS